MKMKYIEKAIEDPHTGADVRYHEITSITVDYKNRYATVSIESYISAKAKAVGKLPVGSPIALTFNGYTPSQAENPVEFFYNLLIQPVPEDYADPSVENRSAGWISPYLFAGGAIKEREYDINS